MRGPIHEQYFGYGPVGGHRLDCAARDSDTWEVSVLRQTRYGTIDGEAAEVEEVTVRLLCRCCGIVIFFGDGFHEHTTVAEIGYGAKPERCGGVWLHPGPPILPRDLDGTGPWAYYVTGSPEPPASEADVIGIVSRQLTPRRALRFTAGYGQRPGGGVITGCDDLFPSKRAAVRWITDTHKRALADLAAEADQNDAQPVQSDSEQAMPR